MNKTVFFFPFPFPPPHEPPFLRKVHAAGIPDFEEEKKNAPYFFRPSSHERFSPRLSSKPVSDLAVHGA